ncbi:MAG TPA: FAD-linked oxidase C-terminal domain-containing protein, partial [Acidobacteriota bacterium]|nr:FAD-linked oxidase C-terminal domain-containing protein [Acidobacteriota bacterium]
YWKLRMKGASQDIFYLTVNDGLKPQIAAVRDIADEAGYPTAEMGIYIQPVVQGTGCHCEFTFFYRPDNDIERDRVRKISADAVRNLLNRGAYFSRPYGENAGIIFNRDAAGVAMLRKFKKVFDPNNIMNPGKACF